jgi:hypothetical protein
MRLVAAVFVVVTLAACGGDESRVRRRECDAVLAHLVVLERGEVDQPMCKYHPDCDGERADRYVKSCSKVLTRTQADCYLRATTLDGADECLPRHDFDDAIRTGQRSDRARDPGDDDPWYGRGSDRSSLGQMRAIRDDACACKDYACAERMQKRFEEWARDNATTSTKPDDDLMKLAMEASECMSRAMSGGYGGGLGYGYYDAAPASGMPACDEYAALVDRIMLCDAYPQSARDAMRDGIEAMRAAWGDPAYMSSSTRDSTNESCRMMVDATKQAMQSMGCP